MRTPPTLPRLALSRLALAAALGLAACTGKEGQDEAVQARELPPVPAEHAPGERLYAANCASCHGVAGVGTEAGPPLVHRVYEPSHHADVAFQLAVSRGVVAHHWRFGNMPPQPQVAAADVAPIVGYVRWLQRQAGIQ